MPEVPPAPPFLRPQLLTLIAARLDELPEVGVRDQKLGRLKCRYAGMRGYKD